MADLLDELEGKQNEAKAKEIQASGGDLLTELEARAPTAQKPVAAPEPTAAPGSQPQRQPIPSGASEALSGFQQAPAKPGGQSFVEPAATILTGMAAEPAAGLMGLGALPFVGGEEAGQVVNEIRDALTYQPHSPEGMAGLESVAKTLEPIIKLLSAPGEVIGDAGYKVAGPAGGAIGKTLPIAILEGIGLASILKPRGQRGATGISDELIADLERQGRSVDELSEAELSQLQQQTVQQVGEQARRLYTDPAARERRFRSAYAQPLSAERRRENLAREISRGKQGSIAAELNPDPDILAAADELGVTIIPSAASGNIIYRELEQGLKSVPGSQLKAAEAEGILQLGQRADDLIARYGGTTNKVGLGLEFEADMKAITKSIYRQENKLYDRLRNAIPPKSPVTADATLSFIRQRADQFGGIDELTPLERTLLNRLSAEGSPTYARLDELRKRVGDAKRGEGEDVFKSASKGLLKKLESLMVADQGSAAGKFEAEDLWRSASRLTAQRKTIESNMRDLMGKKLQDDFLPKVGASMQQLSKGKFKKFRSIMRQVPKQYRQEVALSALNDVFVMGSRKEKQLHIPGFVDWYDGLRRNPEAFNALRENLPERAAYRLDRIATVARGIRRAQESAITTGRIIAVPQLFDNLESTVGKLYGVGVKAAAAEVPASMVAPGVGATSVITRAITKGSTPRSKAADAMLSNPNFMRAVQAEASGDTAAAQAAAEQLRKTQAYNRWRGTLSPRETATIAAMGFIPWLTSREHQEQTKQPETEQLR